MFRPDLIKSDSGNDNQLLRVSCYYKLHLSKLNMVMCKWFIASGQAAPTLGLSRNEHRVTGNAFLNDNDERSETQGGVQQDEEESGTLNSLLQGFML